jgi:phosphate butyryltransferase
MLYKSLAYLAGYTCGAIVIGTSSPVILTSRADSGETKFASLALGIAAS